MFPIDLKQLAAKSRHTCDVLRKLGHESNESFRKGSALQIAELNFEAYQQAAQKQFDLLKAKEEEKTTKQDRIKTLRAKILIAKQKKEELESEVEQEQLKKKSSDNEIKLNEEKDSLVKRVSELKKKSLQMRDANNKQSVDVHTIIRQSDLYTKRLGLIISKLKGGNLRFSFNFIKKESYENEFFFVVKITDEQDYFVKKVSPSIQNLDEMVRKLNETNNFSEFVREIRRRFKELDSV